ncbi:MAG TPA: imidazole glycerol phosphate synthase subunit HisH [Clostridia bacterium]|nr:imidazole glycerol phosphate synthase subunit HisH [Clostridia bacterium]
MIAIIDYGVGNLFSLSSSLNCLNIENKITKDAGEILSSDRVILPGVGAFKDAIDKLKESGLDKVLHQFAATKKPILGICLGMQLLFERSFEYGNHIGLGLIKGVVAPLEKDIKSGLKVPQMGWNEIDIIRQNKLFKYTKQHDYLYFVHSYYAKECEESVIATTEYSIPITAAVASNNVFGTQFHPEKSGDAGLNILKAFSEI